MLTRNKSADKQLVQHVRAARDFSVMNNNQQNREGNNRGGRILALEVHNADVEAFFQRLGFVVQPGDTKEDDTKWMALNIR
jgi:hypothetical protein